MRNYVLNFRPDLNAMIQELAQQAQTLMSQRRYEEVESLFQKQYDLIRKYENELPENFRYHKGATLYNWGVALISQNIPEKRTLGYQKILLAFIEDILDYESPQQAKTLPAYRTLIQDKNILNVLNNIENLIILKINKNDIVKNPEEILNEINMQIQPFLSKQEEIAEIRNKFIDWLDSKWITDHVCPICRSSEWVVSDYLVELREFKRGDLVMGGPIMPIIPLVCNYCGYTMLFNAITSNIMEKNKKSSNNVE